MDTRTNLLLSAAVILNMAAIFNFLIKSGQSSSSSDETSLLYFKIHVTKDPYSKLLSNWSSSTDFCNWVGVSCNPNNGRVSALNLSGMNLEGTIAPQLGNLTFLTSLDISHNNFSGSIPDAMASLSSSLKVVNVSYNNLTGEIPAWFGRFSKLEQLILIKNSFAGVMPSSLCNISNLQILDMAKNYVEGKIPLGIGNLSNLRSLFLEGNKLVGSLPTGMFGISSLQQIYVTKNSFSGNLPRDICNKVSNNLKEIDLSYNSFEGGIPKEIYKCKELEILSLSYNQFGGWIPKEVGYLAKLKALHFEGNAFEGPIPKEIGNLTELSHLNLESNFLSGEIPPSIFNISSLRAITLSNNSLSGSLPSGDMDVYKLPSLERLYLHHNNLTGNLPPFIWNCKLLQVLWVKGNHFSGSISRNIGNLTYLSALHLLENNLTGNLPAEICKNNNLKLINVGWNKLLGHLSPEIFNMTSMEVMSLQFNNFSGPLPSTMWRTLPNLQYIYLDYNNFGGIIPSSISNATNLVTLTMNGNSLTGAIPETIGNLRFLEILYMGENNLTGESSSNKELNFINSLTKCRSLKTVELSQNQFNGFLPPAAFGNFSDSLKKFGLFDCKILGKIPMEIGNLSSLEAIMMDNNEFTGFLPPTIGKLQNLQAIYLEHNRLEGFIPTEFCQLMNLWDLYLDDNMLSGPIPDCMGELKHLGRLYLQNNSFNSSIPSSLWNLSSLFGVNLSSNSLSGHLPHQSMKSSNVILQLDLSWNDFSGDIPASLGVARSLVFLSLAYNGFSGNIPESFGGLMSLEDLDLSHNNLSGMIPRSLEKLNYLKHLNLSVNRLEGRIPTGGPFSNFTAQSFLQNYALCGSDDRLGFPPCRFPTDHHSSSSRLLRYILPPILSALLIVAAIVYICVQKKIHIMKQPATVDEKPLLHEYWRPVSYYELMNATEGFSEENLIGTGSFGSVYKGKLSDETIVAVKVFHMQSSSDVATNSKGRFETECEILRSIRHRNLVKIISCCSNEDFKALVLDYIPNGSLETWLHTEEEEEDHFLEFKQRLNIAIDVASALEYLHHHHIPAVVHCDVKPSNILLDEAMTAYLCDFSISKLFEEGETMEQTMTLATIGYMAPEYGTEGRVSTSGDVYSYGVTLLEMFTKRKPTDHIFGEGLNLKDWVTESLHKQSVMEVVDGNLIRRVDKEQQYFTMDEEFLFSSIFQLALDCLADSPQERINMNNIVSRLHRINAAFLKISSTGK